MTFREFELYAEGYNDTWTRVLETLAWVQANLINVHVGKGKGVKPEQLLPRALRRKQVVETPQPTSAADLKATLREGARMRADKMWLESAEGQAYLKRAREMDGSTDVEG